MLGGKLKLILLVVLVLIIAGAIFWFINRQPEEGGVGINTNQPDILDKGDEQFVGTLSDRFVFVASLSEEDKQTVKYSHDFANLVKHQNICNHYTDSNKQDKCLADVELRQVKTINKSELCKDIVASDNCYKDFAISNSDKVLCDQINDSQERDICLDVIIRKQAFNNNDISLCADIRNDTLKNYCHIGLIAKQNNIAFCSADYIISNKLEEKCKEIIEAEE